MALGAIFFALTGFSAQAQITIMPMGDSITVGVDYYTVTDGGYRDPLYHDLVASGISFTFVGVNNSDATPTLTAAGQTYHNGYGGYQINDLLNNLAGVAAPAGGGDGNLGGYWLTGGGGTGRGPVTPNIILLQIGANDIRLGASAATASANLQTLVTTIHSLTPNTIILIAGTCPFANNPGFNTIIQAYDSYIQNTLVPSLSYTRYVDNYSPFLNADGSVNTLLLGTDDIHPTRYGYPIIAQNWANAIRTLEGSNPTLYNLTVANGTGSGSYPAGSVVTVNSNTPTSGNQFANWTPATSALDNPYWPIATYVMPAAATTVTANYLATGSPAIPNGTYNIVGGPPDYQFPWNSGLSMAAAGTSSGSLVQQQTYVGSGNQQWVLTNLGNNVVELSLPGTTNALSVVGASTTAGANLDVENYTGAASQQWTITQLYGCTEIVNVNSGYAVNIAGYSTQSGSQLVQYNAGYVDNQLFAFYPAGTISPPAAPTGLNASTGSAQISLNWTASSGAISYNIYRGTSAGGESTTAIATGVTVASYIDSGLTNGMTYYYKVAAVNAGGASANSNEASAAPLAGGSTQDINLTGYSQTFDDEFNTLSVTTANPKGAANWYAGPANGSTGDFSESNWNINALSVSNGILTNQAYYANPAVNGQNWQSGEMSSIDPSVTGFSQKYGYFEIRCQMPNAGTGSWPSFWLDSTSGVTGGQNEEIDIFEWYGVTNTPGSDQDFVSEASHNWNPDGSQNTTQPYIYAPQTAMPDGQYPWQAYHTYGCQIDPVHITWYIDGVQTNQIATPTSYITSPFFMILDYALGGGWPLSGSPIATEGSSSLLVDWVRVYSLPSSSAPSAPTGLSAVGGNGQVALNWTAATGATSYNVYRGTSTGGESTTPIATNVTAATYTDTGLTNGTAYYYEVKAVNTYGTSGYSNETSATPVAVVASGTSIGVQFKGSGTALLATDSAGVASVAQSNWNVIVGSTFSGTVLADSTGTATTATVTGGASGIYTGGGSTASPAGNAKLASGEIYNSYPATPAVGIANIPYTSYDVYVYAGVDAAGRKETVTLTPVGGTAQYGSFTTETGGSAWTAATSTWNGTGTAPTLASANYVHYTGLTTGSFTLTWGAPGNGEINGIEIVNTGRRAPGRRVTISIGAPVRGAKAARRWRQTSRRPAIRTRP
jgi:beta-glucanase (GH16 family)